MNSVLDLDFNSILSDLNDGDATDNVPSPYEIHHIRTFYSNTEDVSNHISQQDASHSFLHLNIQCLPAKYDNLVSLLNTYSRQNFQSLPIVLALTETWLNEFNQKSFSLNAWMGSSKDIILLFHA